MSRTSDKRGQPGDFIMVRGGQPQAVWRELLPNTAQYVASNRAGTIMPNALGIIVSIHVTAWTYVLWSVPCCVGWIPDGVLRKL